MHRSAPQRPRLITLDHDKPKDLPISPNQQHPFLQRIGFQTSDGRIK